LCNTYDDNYDDVLQHNLRQSIPKSILSFGWRNFNLLYKRSHDQCNKCVNWL